MTVVFVLKSAFVILYTHTIIAHLVLRGTKIRILLLQDEVSIAWRIIRSIFHDSSHFTVELALKGRVSDSLTLSRNVLHYSSYARREQTQFNYYAPRFASVLPTWLRKAMANRVVRRCLLRPGFCRLLTRYEEFVAADVELSAQIAAMNPQIVVACGWVEAELDWIKAAQRLDIVTVFYAFTWDHLTTKGLIQVQPDYLLCWNDLHAKQAREIHDFPADRIVMTGATFFDKWFHSFGVESRQVLCQVTKLDPQHPFLIYLVSVDVEVADEMNVVARLARFLREHPDVSLRRIQILIRPHPVSRTPLKIDEPNVRLWPPAGIPESSKWVQGFHNGLTHCLAAIGLNNSAMIDTVINNRPCLALISDEYRDFQQVTHFKDLVETQAFYLCKDFQQVSEVLLCLLAGKDVKYDLRQEFIRRFIRPQGLDKPSGLVAAEAIEHIARRGRPDGRVTHLRRNRAVTALHKT